MGRSVLYHSFSGADLGDRDAVGAYSRAEELRATGASQLHTAQHGDRWRPTHELPSCAGNMQDSIEYYSTALALAPHDGIICHSMANVLLEFKRHRAAAQLLPHCIARLALKADAPLAGLRTMPTAAHQADAFYNLALAPPLLFLPHSDWARCCRRGGLFDVRRSKHVPALLVVVPAAPCLILALLALGQITTSNDDIV